MNPEASGAEDRIWTVPNALSLARLLGVPVFLWLVLGPERRRLGARRADAGRLHRLARRQARPRAGTRPAGSAACSTRWPTGSTSWPPCSALAVRDIVPLVAGAGPARCAT